MVPFLYQVFGKLVLKVLLAELGLVLQSDLHSVLRLQELAVHLLELYWGLWVAVLAL